MGMRLAVLIDADNASPAVIAPLLAEVATLGTAVVKRIYGDFTQQNLAGWRAALAEHAIQPIQQFRNTVGKNASDSALIIDAMDLLHGGGLGGFCLVSSDSDFTRLATRIREDGASVFGFGEQKTPRPFIAACDRFIYTELLREKVIPVTAVDQPRPAPAAPIRSLTDPAFRTALDAAYEAMIGDEGRVRLGAIGSQLQKIMPDFDPRNYGVRKLSELVDAEPGFTVSREKTPAGNDLLWVVRAVKRRSAPRRPDT